MIIGFSADCSDMIFILSFYNKKLFSFIFLTTYELSSKKITLEGNLN